MILSTITYVMAQNLLFDGRLTDIDSKKRIGDVTVTVYDGAKQISQTTSATNGKYSVTIPLNKNLKIQYTKNGFVTKTMSVNTNNINEEDIPIGGKYFPPIDIDLFTIRPNLDFSFLISEPVVEWKFYPDKHMMWFDEGKMNAMKSKIENLLEKVDNEGKENDAKYNQLIADADKLFLAKDLENALNKYSEALSVAGKAAEIHPNKRIVEINNLLKLNAKLELQNKYDEFIKVGDAAMKSSNYDGAISAYNEAINIKKEAYPEQQLKLAKDKLAALANGEAKKVKIDGLFASADSKMLADNFAGAIEDYKAIVALESNNTKAITKKVEAEAAWKAQKDNESKLVQFSELKSQGDNFYANEKWAEALGKYEAAKKLVSDDAHTNDRIVETKNKLDQLAKNTEKQKLVKKIMDEGAVAEVKSDWSLAIKKYEEVLKNDENNAEALQKLDSAKKSLEDAKNAAEELMKFNKLKMEGDMYFAQKKWGEAKSKYLEAIDIKPNDKIEGNLNLIDQELSKLASSKEKDDKFKGLIEEAKKEEAAKDLQKAMDLYTEALNFKDSDATTINKINSLKNEISQLAKKAEKEKLYSEAMERGKKALAEKDYAQAIDGFDNAMLQKSIDPEAIKLKAEANKALIELSKNEAAFQKLLAEGQKLKNADKLNAAKDVYVQAQQMRPNEPVPQNAIIEINDLLRKKLEQEESNTGQLALNKKYEEKLDLAVISAQNFDYENAIKHLKEASKIKPDEALPKQKIMEYQTLLEQINKSKMQESKYKDALRKADLAYDAKKYEESIELYREAIGFQDTKYSKDQIIKAEIAIKNRGSEALNREYQNSIKKANDFFSSERYENALIEYNNAVTILPSDKYAQDRRDETQQILNNLTLKSQKEKEDKIIFDQLVSEADALFNEKNYIDAKNKYEEALTYFSSNPYVIKRVDECIRLSKEKGKELEESAYRKVVDKADEYFHLENYDGAKKLYERAISLRAYDRYPKNQLNEIKRILNSPVKEEVSLQYLGEEVNMSILDGEALFAKSEKQREQDKNQGVLKSIFANEKSFEDKSSTDWSERNEYQNEIVYLRDRRAVLTVENNLNNQVLAINLDDEEFNLSKQRLQENNFERSAILRQNDEFIFILEDFNTLHGENKDRHLVNADKLDLIVLDKAELDRSMTDLEEVNRRNITKELIVIADDLRDDGQRAIDMKKVNDNVVRNLDINLSSKSEYETAKNYEKLQVLKSDATITEINRYNSSVEKSLLQRELEDDIAILIGKQSEIAYLEARDVQNNNFEMDAILSAASDKYKASFADNDLVRKETIEDIKVLQSDATEIKTEANNKKYSELQASTREIETVKKLNEAKVVTMDDDLLAIREEIVSQENMITRSYADKNSSEMLKREATVDAIDNAVMNTNKVHVEQSKKPGENSEQVKNIESALNVGEQARKDDFMNRKYETTKLLDDMASNKIQFNETIANTLGDEFPEGVSQQSYLIKDKDGYPQKVSTRRIVVTNGRGEVYLRIQTRNAVTYTKNGQSITEASWLKGTENANLVRHF